jgi:uncharacterized protein
LRHPHLLLALAFLLLATCAQHALAIPTDDLLNSLEPTADVNDYAGLLSPAEKAALEARCRTLREKTGAQLAVVTLQSLRGGQIDDFANKLFARWGIGQKDKKNGLLLIVAMDERKSRVEVGYGLEPIIPDVLAARILDHKLRPRFREKRYAAGLTDTVNALCELVERNEPADRAQLAQPPLSKGDTVAMIFFLAGFVFIGSVIAGVGQASRLIPALGFGLLFAGLALLIASSIAFPLAPVIQVPTGIVGFLIGRGLWRNRNNFQIVGPGQRSTRGSHWNWSDFGSSGGGWSSGSSGGGGFSQDWGGFGGGSSGGGGASSDW